MTQFYVKAAATGGSIQGALCTVYAGFGGTGEGVYAYTDSSGYAILVDPSGGAKSWRVKKDGYATEGGDWPSATMNVSLEGVKPVYHYAWSFVDDTEKRIALPMLTAAGVTIGDVVNQAQVAAANKTMEGLTAQAQQQGLVLSNIVVNAVANYVTEQDWYRFSMNQSPIWTDFYKINVSVYAIYDCDVKLAGSPISPALLTVIKWVIEAIVITLIAYFIIQAIKDWLQSMTTTSNSIVVEEYDQNGHLIKKTTENLISPSLGGMITIGAVGLGMAAGAVALYYLVKSYKASRYYPSAKP